MTDTFDKITHSAPEDARQVGTINLLGAHKVNMMAVPERAASVEDIEAREAAYFDAPKFPIPFWDMDDGSCSLEPLMTADYAMLNAAGITPEEWEIAVLEDHMERTK